MNGDQQLYKILGQLGIEYEYHEHPPAPTIDEAMKYWKGLRATHCKNIFFVITKETAITSSFLNIPGTWIFTTLKRGFGRVNSVLHPMRG